MSTSAPYDDHDRARRVAEPAKRAYFQGTEAAWRSPFERDRARILHCSALRRLAAKTQVVVPLADDFPRTRLTHSLEVAQIGREMGAALGCDADVVDSAGLAHDLGHPPFGHNGEDALHSVAEECGGFEGNAQTLRVLTRLEAKVLDPAGRSAGINPTRAVLDATAKYPWPRREGERKFGVYADDLAVFEWMRAGAPAGRRCLEAQVMDWADDVAYSVHDIEDGLHGGHIRLDRLADPDERAAVCADAAALYVDEPPDALAGVLTDLLALPALADMAGYDGSLAGRVALKRATSELLGRFTAAAVGATRDKFGPDPLRRYAADLVVPRQMAAECALLKGIAYRYVMRRSGAASLQERQREVLCEVVDALLDRPEELELGFRSAYAAAADDAGRRRAVIDQVASLTDNSAVAWHHRLTQEGGRHGRTDS